MSISSTAISISLSAGRSRDYFYLSAVVNLCLVPDSTTYDLAIDGDRDTSGFNVVTDQKLFYRLVDEGLIDAVHPNHAKLRANSSASSELWGAKVTP